MFHYTTPFNVRDNAEKGRELMERVLEMAMDQPLNPLGRVSGALSSFRVDVTESENVYDLYAELPGFSKEEVKVTYDKENRLTVSAERAEMEIAGKYLCRERRTGKFERSFSFDDVAVDEVTVSLEQGVLHVVLPKTSADKDKKVFDIT